MGRPNFIEYACTAEQAGQGLAKSNAQPFPHHHMAGIKKAQGCNFFDVKTHFQKMLLPTALAECDYFGEGIALLAMARNDQIVLDDAKDLAQRMLDSTS